MLASGLSQGASEVSEEEELQEAEEVRRFRSSCLTLTRPTCLFTCISEED